ncbi:MAG: hypothetical protein AAGA66_10075 [Bacteroidota bacterium]
MILPEYEERIIRHVETSEISNQSLKEDLIDHLCCLVEMELKAGNDFNDAYEKALQQTAPNGLNEIQNETIFLLNYSKIMLMKRLTYVLGYIFALAWVIGIFFKLMHLPGATILMFSGGTGLAFIFFPLLLINRFKKSATKLLSERLKWVFGVASVIIFMIASWMKFAHLMGAGVILAFSFLVFGFGFLPFLFFRMYKKSVDEL